MKRADFDCAIVVFLDTNWINVYFARIPDAEVANTVFALEEYPSIKIQDECAGFVISGNESNTKSNDKERTHYAVDVSWVYDVQRIANELREAIASQHGFSIRMIVREPPQNETKISIRT